MTEFEFFFTLYGLLLGLTLAEIAVKFADAIAARAEVPLGTLTPMFALFILLDITSFWMWTWSGRDAIHINWPTLYAALAVALSYFMAACLVFPRRAGEWANLDEYYFQSKNIVIIGIICANLPVILFQFSAKLPELSDFWFFFWQTIYWLPLVMLLFARSRRANQVLLALLVAQWLLVASSLLPNSQWGDSVGLNGDAARAQASGRTPG